MTSCRLGSNIRHRSATCPTVAQMLDFATTGGITKRLRVAKVDSETLAFQCTFATACHSLSKPCLMALHRSQNRRGSRMLDN